MSKSIFLIDDDEDDVEFFRQALQKVDPAISYSHAFDAEEGLELLLEKSRKPDFIFLDLNMPRLNGKEFLKMVKSDQNLYQIPVIIFTTSGIDSDRQETIRMGAHAYIVKPTSLKELVKEVTAAISTA